MLRTRCSALALVALLACVAAPASASALGDGQARTPPMGWNSWNHFTCTALNEKVVRQTADAMVSSGMRSAGYRYVNVDDCWSIRDASGRLTADPVSFPSGIPALARYVHARGLRLGLYSDVGTQTCAKRPGLAGHERDDIDRLASWGVDYLKVDFCNVSAKVRRHPATAYRRLRDLIARSGRRMVFSICTWGQGSPRRWAPGAGHLWRSTGDLRDTWQSVMRNADLNNRHPRQTRPGAWSDPDMLQVGNGGMTAREDRTHFSLWAVMAAPLIAGNDVRQTSPATRSTLLNREVIAVDQDPAGRQGRRVSSRHGHDVWVKRLRGGARAVLVVNRGRHRATFSTVLRRVGLPRARRYRVRDLWRHRSRATGPVLRATVAPHGVAFFRVRSPRP